jgi:endonuclease/exonuclease/phosphatase family metal-dependent hydrolase
MGKHSRQVEKKRRMPRIFKIIGILLLLVFLLVAGLAAFLSITEYKPADSEALSPDSVGTASINAGDSFTMLTWNLGYGALGNDTDFFMDGGTGVMTADEERVLSNMDSMISEMKKNSPDILFLQEVDLSAARSHYIDEYKMLMDAFPGYGSFFAYNYKVAFIPFPWPPLGKVHAGISTLSRYMTESAERIQLPISFKWPVSMANLKRCLLVTRIPVKGSACELVLINLHLEAYDKGAGKIAQTKMLAELLNEEYKKGNYVIAAGDFNQIFSSEDNNAYPLQEGTWHPGVIDITGIEGAWSFLMDESIPSCRSLDKPYIDADKDSFQYYLIDGYIVSGNIEVEEFKNIDLDFACSDHNPVLLKARLK